MSKKNIVNKLLYVFMLGLLVSFMGCKSNELKSDLELDEVITRWQKATDPNGILKKCKGYILQQEATIKNKEGDDEKIVTVIYYKSPSIFKTVQFKNGKIFRKLYLIGEKAYSFYPETQKLIPLKGRSLNLIRVFTAIGDPHKEMTKIFKHIDLSLVQEQETKNTLVAKYFYKLVCDSGLSGVPIYTIYIDRDTFLTYKMETMKISPSGSFKYVSFIKKYGMLEDGIRYALETHNVLGSVNTIFTVTNYEINPVFRKDEFKLPEPWFDKK